MKKLFSRILLLTIFSALFHSCEKDMDQNVLVPPARVDGFSASADQIVLSEETDDADVITFSFTAPEYGVHVIRTYTLQFDVPSDTSGPNAWANAVNVKLPIGSLQKTYKGKDFNSMLVNQLGLPTETSSQLAVRIKAEVNQSTGTATTVEPIYSSLTITVTPYKAVVIYPALVVKGGNSWQTPPTASRENGFILTSAGFNNKYEGYLNLPNADGWGGDAFTLISTVDGKSYGWGTSATTIAEGTGNLWLTPSPAYMKVNVDLDAKTISYTPVEFFISGDDNGWSTSATPMSYDAESKTWVAENVSLTAGKSFVFTANGSYDISYKVDNDGKLIFAGPPAWAGNNIPVEKTGVYTVTLDLSGGAGNYTYSIK